MADKKQQIKNAAADDGVWVELGMHCGLQLITSSQNPGGIAIGAFSAAYLVFVPITYVIEQESWHSYSRFSGAS